MDRDMPRFVQPYGATAYHNVPLYEHLMTDSNSGFCDARRSSYHQMTSQPSGYSCYECAYSGDERVQTQQHVEK